jgi:hypothetical protein
MDEVAVVGMVNTVSPAIRHPSQFVSVEVITGPPQRTITTTRGTRGFPMAIRTTTTRTTHTTSGASGVEAPSLPLL